MKLNPSHNLHLMLPCHSYYILSCFKRSGFKYFRRDSYSSHNSTAPHLNAGKDRVVIVLILT